MIGCLPVTEGDVKDAIAVILEDTTAYTTSLNYAVGYARLAQHMTGEDLRVQCLYILGNISHWRSPQAKEVRITLKGFCHAK
jgi:hypothetical protein